MAYVQVDIDEDELRKLSKKLEAHPQLIRAATVSALNRTLTFIGAETKRQVKKDYAVTKSINKSIKMTRATRGNLTAIAEYTDKPLPMFVFKHSVAQNKFRSPVTITIKHSNGKQTHDGSNPALFRGYGKKIMRRESGQENIRTAYTISIPQMVASDAVYNVIAEKAKEYFFTRFEHEVNWRLENL